MKGFTQLPREAYHQESNTLALEQATLQQVWKAKESYIDFLLQLHPATATWGLTFFEWEYGIPTNTTKSLEERRSQILAKRRGTGTTTVSVIENMASSFLNGEVQVEEHNVDYYVQLIFKSHLGIPSNLQDLLSAVQVVLPAHLGFEYTVLYNTHEYLSQFPHEFLAGYTQHELRTKKLDNDWEIWKNSHNTHGELRRYPHHYLADFTHQQIRTTRPLAKE